MLASDPFFYGGGWTADAAHKVTRFVDFAETFHLPVVHLVDIPGFLIGVAAEKAATIRHGARALAAVYRPRCRGARSWCARRSASPARRTRTGSKYNFRYAWPSGDWGSLPIEGGIEAAYKAELEAAPDPAAQLAEIEARLNKVRSPFRTAERFGIEEIIDPRDTRRLLCEFANLAAPLRKPGPRSFGYRPMPRRWDRQADHRQDLQNAATFYLERYPSTAEGLRRVLNRRVRKAEMAEAPVIDNVKQVIDAIVAKFVEAGVIDTRPSPRPRRARCTGAARSNRFTRQKLRFAGVDGDTLDKAMAGPRPGARYRSEAARVAGGRRLARRRRLGPFRQKDRKEHRDSDLAAMRAAASSISLPKR